MKFQSGVRLGDGPPLLQVPEGCEIRMKSLLRRVFAKQTFYIAVVSGVGVFAKGKQGDLRC